MRASTPVVLVGIAVLTMTAGACGARTSLRQGEPGEGGAGGAPGSGGAGGQPGADASSSAAGGSAPGCEAEAFGGPTTEGAQRVEADATHAYWTTVDGRLVRGRFGGGPVETLARDLVDVGDLALDGDRVVVAAAGQLLAIPTSGGDPVVLADDLDPVVTLAADASGIYWMSGGSGILAYRLERLAPDGTRVALASPIDHGIGLALAGDDVVFTATTLPGLDELGIVARVPKLGGAITTIAEGRPDPTNVFVRGDAIYWTEQLDVFDGPVGVVRLGPGDAAPVQVLTAPDGALPILSAATDTTVVLTALDLDRGALLLAAPLDGGATTVVEEAPGFFLEPVASGRRVAWTVQPAVDDPDAVGDAEVRVRCF